MRPQDWFAATRGFLQSVYERATGFELKRLTLLVVVAFVAYYAIDGRGRTVIAEFRIPQHLQKDLGGMDEKTLTHQLMVELDRIRAVQDAAAKLKISLVKGLGGATLKGDPLRIELSATYNTEYHTLIQSIGTFEWGPVQVPAALILRPFQKLIGQNLLQISLQRAGDRYMLFASADSGDTWWVTEDEASSDEASAKGSGDRLVQMLRSLAYKIASPEGAGQRATGTWLGFYHFHQGLRHLVVHFAGDQSSETNAATVLDSAAREFQRAIGLNPRCAPP